MRSIFVLLALCAGLPAFAQSQSLVVCSEAAPEGFDIVQYTAATTADASAETVYERLVQFAPGSTRIVPALAESWEVGADGLTYTFTLRKGVQFHQTPWFKPSRELNSDDVLWSFQRQRDKDHPWHALSPRGYPYFEAMGFAELIEKIEALDEHRVRFTLKHPEAPFLADLAMGFTSIYSAEYAEQLLDAETPQKLNSQPIGTGPYTFGSWDRGSRIVLERNDDYHGQAPYFAAAEMQYFKDANSLNNAMLTDAIDIVSTVQAPESLAEFEGGDFQIIEGTTNGEVVLSMNQEEGNPLADPALRAAEAEAAAELTSAPRRS